METVVGDIEGAVRRKISAWSAIELVQLSAIELVQGVQ
jgi:hypothetical protein